jgi:hypothetical protein
MKEMPPKVKPKEEFWEYCEELAERHEMLPMDVLKRLVEVGRCAANIEEKGGEVFGRIMGREVNIKVFSKNGS